MKLEKALLNFVSTYTDAELTQICKSLNRDYNIYDPDEVRWKKIAYAFSRSSQAEVDLLRDNMSSNKVINDLLLQYYICERVVKYYFIEQLRSLKKNTVAFEMTVGDNRVDICRINGGTYAYEIKTEYDAFDRLENQLSSYAKAFEKVYVIIPNFRVREVLPLLPDFCGIISYRTDTQRNLVFSHRKKAHKNICDISFCIDNMSCDDMGKLLQLMKQKVPKLRAERICAIEQGMIINRFWKQYKAVLKAKYSGSWEFLQQHFEEILPIDVQNFFATSIDPQLLY